MPIRRNPQTGNLEKISDIAISAENQTQGAPQVDLHAIAGKVGVQDLKQAEQPDDNKLYDIGAPETQPALNRMVTYVNQKKELQARLDKAAATNPTLWGGLVGLATEPSKVGSNILDAGSRALTIGNNVMTGLFQGTYNVASGQGTFWDGLSKSVRNQEHFSDFLTRVGVPEGPTFQPQTPNAKFGALGGFLQGTTENVIKKQAVLSAFGPKLTARGTVGLAADILLDPLTYLEFGNNIPGKVAALEGAPAVRWFNHTLLTQGELADGFKALKATKAGHAIYDMIDRFTGTTLFKGVHETVTDLKGMLGSAFIPDYGMHKPTADLARQVEQQIFANTVGIRKSIGELGANFSDAERKEMTSHMFDANFMEALAGKGTVPQSDFLGNTKYAAAYRKMVDQTKGIASRLGLPEDQFYNNYFPAIKKDIAEGFKKNSKKFQSIARSKGLLKKDFVLDQSDVKDIFSAFADRTVELMRVERLNNGFIKKVVSKYGKVLPEALDHGFDEFYPEDIKAFFKGTSLDSNLVGLGEKSNTPIFLPNKVVSTIQDLAERNKTTKNDLLRMYDDFTNKYWKATQTSVFPGFHFRNNTNNFIRAYGVQGVKAFNPDNDMKAFKMLNNSTDLSKEFLHVPSTGHTYSLSKVKKWMNKFGILDHSGQVGEVMKDMERQVPGNVLAQHIDKMANGFADSSTLATMRDFGRSIENHGKARIFVQGLKDGFSPKEAANLAFTALFDYTKLTPFERNVMKRVMPFYTFTRKNISAQFDTLLRHPGRQAAIVKITRDVRDEALRKLTPDQKQAFNDLKDDWINNAYSVPVGMDKDGNPMWMTGFGIGQEDIMDMIANPGSSLNFRQNPLIKSGESAIFEAIASSRGVALKDKYDIAEVKHLFPKELAKNVSEQDVMKFVNDSKFQNFPLVKLLGLRVIQQPEFKNGKKTGAKKTVLQGDSGAVNLMKDLLASRAWSTTRMLNNPNIDEVHKFAQFSTGIGFAKAVTDRNAAVEKNELQRKLGLVAKESGVGGNNDDAFTVAPELRGSFRKANKLRY